MSHGPTVLLETPGNQGGWPRWPSLSKAIFPGAYTLVHPITLSVPRQCLLVWYLAEHPHTVLLSLLAKEGVASPEGPEDSSKWQQTWGFCFSSHADCLLFSVRQAHLLYGRSGD